MPTTETHELTLTRFAPGRTQAFCDCGWVADDVHTRQDSIIEHETHLARLGILPPQPASFPAPLMTPTILAAAMADL